MDGDSSPAMRLLPDWTDHASYRPAERKQESQRSGYRHGYVGQHLPLRNLPAHSRGDSSGCEGDGMNIIENVSQQMGKDSRRKIGADVNHADVNHNDGRRRFLQGVLASGVFVLSARIIPGTVFAAGEKEAATLETNLWMSIEPDGIVTIVAHRSEMGCGSRTALPLVLADEFDADWSNARIEQAMERPK